MKNTQDSFWRKVDIKGPDDCWNWLAGKSGSGYGSFEYEGKTRNAHKLSWEFTNGPVPAGLLVCHKCDNPACCNPSHLYLGTHSDNACDKITRDPAPPEWMGMARAKFHEGEIWLIRKLMIPIRDQGMRKAYKFSSGFVAKMFKTDKSTIQRIWREEKVLCKEGYYV